MKRKADRKSLNQLRGGSSCHQAVKEASFNPDTRRAYMSAPGEKRTGEQPATQEVQRLQ